MTDGTAEPTPYVRGHADGEIAARLADHDAHFARINSSIEKFAAEVRSLVLAVQRAADTTEADRLAAIATAAAVKEAGRVHREIAARRWSPAASAAAAATAAAVIAAAVAVLIANLHG